VHGRIDTWTGLDTKESRVTAVYSCSDLLSQIKRLAFLAQGGKGGTDHIFVGESNGT